MTLTNHAWGRACQISIRTLKMKAMIKNHRTVMVLTIVLAILSLLVGTTLALAQGRAVRESTKPKSDPKPSATSTFQPKNPALELVRIPPGSFMMGSTNGTPDEVPVHQVTIKYSFYIGKYEVTQAQWQALMGDNPSNFKDCPSCPVEKVSWDDTQKFIQKLNQMNDGYTYRLPTEAEWEYANRAGTTGDYAGALNEVAWYFENSGNKTHPVGGKRPNSWGLADMHGNVWEWCDDWYHDSYLGAPTDGSAWLNGGAKGRVLRGGSWHGFAVSLRSAARLWSAAGDRDRECGFRVVATARTN